MTTGWPLTVKCFSNFWSAPDVSGRSSTPLRIEVRTGNRDLGNAGLRLISVHAPTAFHHCGQNLCFLLIGGGQIVPRHLVVGVFLEALAAFLDEGVDRGQILTERVIHRRRSEGARRLHGV